MADESSEMSLDDVLSSIKQMVIDKDPPVLELTDMLSSDGRIVNVKSVDGSASAKSSADSGNSDIKTFLQLVQSSGENEVTAQEKLQLENLPTEKLEEAADQGKPQPESNPSEKLDEPVTHEKPFLESNLSEKLDQCDDKRSISEIVTNITTALVKTWLDEHLENVVRDVVKQEVKNLIVK